MPRLSKAQEKYLSDDIMAFRGTDSQNSTDMPNESKLVKETAKEHDRSEFLESHDSQPYNLFSAMRETGKRSPTKH